MRDKRIFLAITGASGSLYAQKFLESLLMLGSETVRRIYIVATPTAKKVCELELKKNAFLLQCLYGQISELYKDVIRRFDPDDFFAPLASGSSAPTHMVVLPCSMGTLGRMATAVSGNLIERSADVMLKQKKTLILAPRETPLHTVHLEHMVTLSRMGAHIVPAMPAFYQKPKTIDDLASFIAGRILELCDLDHDLYQKWNHRRM